MMLATIVAGCIGANRGHIVECGDLGALQTPQKATPTTESSERLTARRRASRLSDHCNISEFVEKWLH